MLKKMPRLTMLMTNLAPRLKQLTVINILPLWESNFIISKNS